MSSQIEPDEQGLWRRVRNGDRRAADELARTTYALIYRSLFKLCGGDEPLAADLTQETYRKAWSSLDKFRGRCRFSTWLYRIAFNTYLNHARKPLRLVALDEPRQAVLVEDRPDPEMLASRSVAAQRTREAVMELPEDLRFAVTARYWAELPLREIARLQGVTSPAVTKRLKRALQQLSMTLEEVHP